MASFKGLLELRTPWGHTVLDLPGGEALWASLATCLEGREILTDAEQAPPPRLGLQACWRRRRRSCHRVRSVLLWQRCCSTAAAESMAAGLSRWKMRCPLRFCLSAQASARATWWRSAGGCGRGRRPWRSWSSTAGFLAAHSAWGAWNQVRFGIVLCAFSAWSSRENAPTCGLEAGSLRRLYSE